MSNSSSWATWWEQAQSQAKDFANKAQELAEQASKAAAEQAQILAKQASEIQFDVAASQIVAPFSAKPSTNESSDSNETSSELDLVYVTENIITMAFPVDTTKKSVAQSGNDINKVARFLKKRHGGHYMIWNVSEDSYDYSKFDDQVLEYKFPGHPSPPLGLLFKICTSVESWLDADEKNVAVVHCLTGKGRTAALVACILAWIGEFGTPMEALQYVAERRAVSVDYLTIPSQRRYIQYFTNMLDGVRPRPEPLLLRRIIFNTIPVFGDNGQGEANAGCCPYIQLFKCGKLIATAAPVGIAAVASAQDKSDPNNNGVQLQQNQLQLKWVRSSESNVSFSVDCAIQGDILLRCRHVDPSGVRVSVFRAAFHTGYVPNGVFRMTKAQLDGASTDLRFEDDFFVDLIFAPIDASGGVSSVEGGSSAQATPVNIPSDSGLVMDAATLDRYEATLHRDTRFWDAVAVRKSRSKKRNSRKFVSTSQDRFSIADDLGGLLADSLNVFKFSDTSSSNETNAEVAAQLRKNAALSDEELIMQLAQSDGIASPQNPDSQLDDMEEFIRTLTTPSTVSITNNTEALSSSDISAAVKGELDALEELEKALGLDELRPTNNTESCEAKKLHDTGNDNENETETVTASSSSEQTPSIEESWSIVSDSNDNGSQVQSPKKESASSDDVNIEDLEKYLDSLN